MPRPAKPWFRVYSDALDSPKLNRLKPATFAGWFKLMCLANVTRPRGTLPPLRDVAFRLRVNERAARDLLSELAADRLVDLSRDVYVMHDWDEWQAERDVAPSLRDEIPEINHGNSTVTAEINHGNDAVTTHENHARGEERREEQKRGEIEREGDAGARRRTVDSVSEQDLEELQGQYPTLNVRDCWESAKDWLISEGKTKRDYLAFLRNWLKRERDNHVSQTRSGHSRGGAQHAATVTGSPDELERWRNA